MNLAGDSRGVVALWICLMIPTFVLSIALPAEYGQWVVAKEQTQMAADLAALAGMTDYRSSVNFNIAALSHQPPLATIPESEMVSRAESVASALAMVNRAGTVSAIMDGPGPALTVIVSQAVPLVMLSSLSGHTSLTVASSGTSELSGPQPPPNSPDTRQALIVH